MNLPTQEELEKAQKYKDKVPNYQVSSGKGQIHSGIIIDSSNYPNYMGQPSDQQPAPVEVFQNNNQPSVSSLPVEDNQNIQVNIVDNQDMVTESDRPFVPAQNQQGNILLQAQIQEKETNP